MPEQPARKRINKRSNTSASQLERKRTRDHDRNKWRKEKLHLPVGIDVATNLEGTLQHQVDVCHRTYTRRSNMNVSQLERIRAQDRDRKRKQREKQHFDVPTNIGGTMQHQINTSLVTIPDLRRKLQPQPDICHLTYTKWSNMNASQLERIRARDCDCKRKQREKQHLPVVINTATNIGGTLQHQINTSLGTIANLRRKLQPKPDIFQQTSTKRSNMTASQLEKIRAQDRDRKRRQREKQLLPVVIDSGTSIGGTLQHQINTYLGTTANLKRKFNPEPDICHQSYTKRSNMTASQLERIRAQDRDRKRRQKEKQHLPVLIDNATNIGRTLQHQTNTCLGTTANLRETLQPRADDCHQTCTRRSKMTASQLENLRRNDRERKRKQREKQYLPVVIDTATNIGGTLQQQTNTCLGTAVNLRETLQPRHDGCHQTCTRRSKMTAPQLENLRRNDRERKRKQRENQKLCSNIGVTLQPQIKQIHHATTNLQGKLQPQTDISLEIQHSLPVVIAIGAKFGGALQPQTNSRRSNMTASQLENLRMRDRKRKMRQRENQRIRIQAGEGKSIINDSHISQQSNQV